MLKTTVFKRIASMLLAITLLVTFAAPVSAMGFDDLATVIDMTDGSASEPEPEPPGDSDSSAPDPDYDDPGGSDNSRPDVSDDSRDESDDVSTDGEPSEAEPAVETAASMSFDEWVNGLYLAGSRPSLGASSARAAASQPGDTGTVQTSQVNINYYYVTHSSFGWAEGSIMLIMKINGDYAFCTQIWNNVGGGTYTAGNATSGNSTTARYIANFEASNKTVADYVATQVLVWESLYGEIGLYNQIIAGTTYVSAYNTIKNGNNHGEGLLFWTGTGDRDQEIVTLIIDRDPPIEPPDPPPGEWDEENIGLKPMKRP